MGEHAAVYGHPALVTALDRRLHVTLESRAETGLHLDLPQVQVDDVVAYGDLWSYGRRCAEAWQRYRDAPSPESFRQVTGDDPAHLIKVAVGETLEWLRQHAPSVADLPPLHLHLHSEIPLGAGFGSSAAASVAVVVALLRWQGLAPDADALHALTLDVERRQHGMPSGVDNAAVLHGGLVWAERRGDGALHMTPLTEVASDWLSDIRIFNTGRPGQSTGDVVAAVRRLRQDDRGCFDDAMAVMASSTRRLYDLLRSGAREDTLGGTADIVVDCMRRFQGGLEALGVVPESVRSRVRQVEAAGGAAKISGAGALRGPGAGSLLVYHPHPEALDGAPYLQGLEPLDASLGASGVLSEPADRV